MTLIVKKFGGSSVDDINRIKHIAKIIREDAKNGNQIVVAVSAMGSTTDDLVKKAKQISQKPSMRELDMLLTAGERITMSLLSIALNELGLSSISFTGSQSGIITDNNHGNARIKEVKAFRILEELKKGKIVIVAGFQGVSSEKEVTTLGRGGSDTTAVALAGYLKADKCQIYKDVEGIFSSDPRIIKEAKKIDKISYEKCLLLSYSGAEVIHPRAVEFAQNYNIELEVLSSFNSTKGTILTKETQMQEAKIEAIISKSNLFFLRITDFEDSQKLENLEIYDFEIKNTAIDLFIEESNFLQTKYKFLSPYIEKKALTAITIIGNSISHKVNLALKIKTSLENLSVDTFKIVRFEMGIRFYINNYSDEILKKIHKQLMEI